MDYCQKNQFLYVKNNLIKFWLHYRNLHWLNVTVITPPTFHIQFLGFKKVVLESLVGKTPITSHDMHYSSIDLITNDKKWIINRITLY